MSPSVRKLTVDAVDKVAEISVLDGNLNPVARGIGRLSKELNPGLYKIRVRVGPTVDERLVSLDADRHVTFDLQRFPSAVPLRDTSKSHEYIGDTAHALSSGPTHIYGSGATIFVFSREWSPPEGRGVGNPAAGLKLVDASGKLLEDIGHVAQIQKIPDVLASCSIAVAPGEYRLRLDRADRPALERALIAVAGWQTQIFLLQRDDGTVRRPDLEGGSVVMSNRGHFAPEDELTRLSELARYALTQHHKILSEDLRQVLRGKFEDPMLGLFGAHLIIRDMPQDEEILENVFVNLEMLLGNNHPDVMALSLRRKLPQAPTIREFHQPPMLRASWDLIVEASFASPSLISIGSPVERIGGQVLPTSSWLTWRTTTAAMGVAEEPVGRQPVLAALADYMRARVVANFPDGTSRAVEAVEQPATSLSELDQASKAELARSFGVPRLALEGMLDKLPK